MNPQRTFWLGSVAGFGIAIVAFGLYALQAPESAARTVVAKLFHVLNNCIESIGMSGPILGSLYLFMLLGFALSLILAFRRRGSLAAFAASLSPFVFGATAMWISFFGFAQVTSSSMYEGDYRRDVRRMQRPFSVGLGMSAVCLLVYLSASPFTPQK